MGSPVFINCRIEYSIFQAPISNSQKPNKFQISMIKAPAWRLHYLMVSG
jgi:hypothetical protein